MIVGHTLYYNPSWKIKSIIYVNTVQKNQIKKIATFIVRGEVQSFFIHHIILERYQHLPPHYYPDFHHC